MVAFVTSSAEAMVAFVTSSAERMTAFVAIFGTCDG
jgi:hypothetical protein